MNAENFALKIDDIEFEDEVEYNLIIRKDNLKILVLIITERNQHPSLGYRESLKDKGFSILTIDFSRRKKSAFWDTFPKSITEDTDKKILYNCDTLKEYFDKKIYDLAENYKIMMNIVPGCPRMTNPSYTDTCMKCTALIDEVEGNNHTKYVRCLGAVQDIYDYKELENLLNEKKSVTDEETKHEKENAVHKRKSVPKCDCGRDMKIRNNKNNEAFWGCLSYGRQCTAKYIKPLKCPKCGGKLYLENSKKYSDFLECKTFGCGYAESVSSFLKGFRC